MIFADNEFYENEYLLGRAALIPPVEFLYWASEASERINWRKAELDDIPDYLKKCTCAVAEALYRAEKAQGTPETPVKRSESIGEYSVSYAVAERSQGEIEAVTDSLIRKWLSSTPLHNLFIYRGSL